MPEGTFESRLRAWRGDIERALDRYLPPAETPPASLHRAMRHAVFAGGKRLRPILALAACGAVASDTPAALPAACALEMIHTYSLVHDDLPAMDDDDLRRGQPTTHVLFGEAHAILAGDALLTLAMEILASEPPGDAYAPSRCAVAALVARAAGPGGMVGGQADDLDAEGLDPDGPREELLLSIHRRKTGALITASVLAGGLMGGASEEQAERLRRYGEAAGLAFQIVDDILDVESSTEALGKSVGKDARDTKLTFPAVVGLEEAWRRAERLRVQAWAEADALGPRAAILGEIADFIIARKN